MRLLSASRLHFQTFGVALRGIDPWILLSNAQIAGMAVGKFSEAWFSSFFSILLSLQLRKCPTSDHISLIYMIYLAIFHVLSCVSFPSHQCSSLLSLYFLSFFLVVLQPFFDFSCSDPFRCTCVFLVLLFCSLISLLLAADTFDFYSKLGRCMKKSSQSL